MNRRSYNITSKPHAMDKAVMPTGVFPSTPQTVTYTGFDKVLKVKQGGDSLVYTYGHGHQRIAMEEHVGNTVRTKRYVGACEHVTETMGSLTTDRWLTYLSGPFGVFAVVERRQGVNTLHYILKDHLGSWTTITASDGTLEQRLSYDAWGNLRNPETWANYSEDETYEEPMFDRGYTGHEHLAAFGLINMNGRMYDPMMSSFLSVDRFVQSLNNSQSFNRYAYCLYNPLRYVDPTGWVMSRPEGSGILPPPDGDEFDDYVPGMVTSGGYSSEYDAYTYSYNLHEVTVSASRYTWAEEQCRNITWYGREEYSPEYSGGEVYISYGGIGGGGGACSNGSWNTKEIVNGGIQLSGYVLSVTSSLQSCQGYTLKTSEDYTRIGKNLNKAQKAKLALKYPEQLSKSASAAKYGRAVAKGMRQSGNILGAVGVGLELAEVGLSGEVYASNFYNVTIGIACIVAGPYGWIIGGVALVGDIAFYAFTGRNIGGNIDRLFDDKGLRIFGGVY